MNKTLNKIADYLIFYNRRVRDIGLFHGKIGIVVALATYAKKYNDKILKDFAWDLYEDVFNNITSDMPIGIESGLAGIGYGTTLLKQLDFVNCDLNDILPDGA